MHSKNRIWEPYETALILEHLWQGSVFLDIGANIGIIPCWRARSSASMAWLSPMSRRLKTSGCLSAISP